VIKVIEYDGTAPVAQDYDAFGAADGAVAKNGPGFNGAPSVDGFQYLRNRWYDPNVGRFTQEDPIGFAGGINLYAYAGSNPVSFSDPYGLCPQGMSPDECNRDQDPGGIKANLTASDKSGGAVSFQGVSLTGVLGGGYTVAAGIYQNNQGHGVYFKIGVLAGLEGGVAHEIGRSTNLSAFTGQSTDAGGNLGPGGLGHAWNDKGSTTHVSTGEGLPVGGHFGVSRTFATHPTAPGASQPRNPFDCGQPQPSNSVCNR
jgi:RHS repeat-associated protein